MEKKTSKLAIWSLVLSITGLCSLFLWFILNFGMVGAAPPPPILSPLLIILSIVFGIIGLVKISTNELKGKWFAIIGLVLSGIIFVLIVFAYVMVFTYVPIRPPVIIPVEAIPATAYDPLITKDNIYLKPLDSEEEKVQFYNRNESIAQDVRFRFRECTNVDTEQVMDDALIPEILSIKRDVQQNEAIGFKIIIKEKGLSLGTYVCHFDAMQENSENIYESKMVFVVVNP